MRWPARSARVDEVEEREVVAGARIAWADGDPERAARVIEEYLARHPDRREALLALAAADTPAPAEPLPAAVRACLRCGRHVARGGRVRLHNSGYLTDVLMGDLFVGRVEADVYACPTCGHVEFTLEDAHLLAAGEAAAANRVERRTLSP